MPTYSINIINPVINPISEESAIANSCTTIHSFKIRSSPYAEIEININRVTGLSEAYKYAQIDLGSGWITLTPVIARFTLNDTGEALFRLIQGNAYLLAIKEPLPMGDVNNPYPDGGAPNESVENIDPCNTVEVIVRDITNSVEKTTTFRRCISERPCGELPIPVAKNDQYKVRTNATIKMDILNNDSSGSSYSTITPVLDSQPLHGTVEILPSGLAKYTNNGDGSNTDSFTYHVVSSDGKTSEVATVNITVMPYETIDSNTKINIVFDSSGSMGTLRDTLISMRNGLLKSKLLPYYGGNDSAYNNNVRVLEDDSERFLLFLSNNLNNNGRTINIVFQNEAGRESTFFNIERGYHDSNCRFSPDGKRLKGYNEDMSTFNSRLNAHTQPYNGIVFQIDGCNGFKLLLEAMQQGLGNYSGTNGFSLRDNITVKYDQPYNGTAEYYANGIVEALNELGFNI